MCLFLVTRHNIKNSNLLSKVVLCSKHHAMKAYWKSGGEWSASRPSHFTPREKASGTHRIGGWVGSRAVLDAVMERKIPSPGRESNPRTPIVQPVAQSYSDWAITAVHNEKLFFKDR
jgi:hypothetical protein